jgi:hypothetical protein
MRLAGWAKLWTAVAFLFPQVSYASVDWSKEFAKQIPAIEAAPTTVQYYEALRRITAPLNDSHVFFSGESAGQSATFLPAMVRLVEGKVAITSVLRYPDGTIPPLHIGDVIVEVNGTPVAGVMAKFRPLTAASSQNSLEQALASHVAAETWSAANVSLLVDGREGRRTLTVPTLADCFRMEADFRTSGSLHT